MRDASHASRITHHASRNKPSNTVTRSNYSVLGSQIDCLVKVSHLIYNLRGREGLQNLGTQTLQNRVVATGHNWFKGL